MRRKLHVCVRAAKTNTNTPMQTQAPFRQLALCLLRCARLVGVALAGLGSPRRPLPARWCCRPLLAATAARRMMAICCGLHGFLLCNCRLSSLLLLLLWVLLIVLLLRLLLPRLLLLLLLLISLALLLLLLLCMHGLIFFHGVPWGSVIANGKHRQGWKEGRKEGRHRCTAVHHVQGVGSAQGRAVLASPSAAQHSEVHVHVPPQQNTSTKCSQLTINTADQGVPQLPVSSRASQNCIADNWLATGLLQATMAACHISPCQ